MANGTLQFTTPITIRKIPPNKTAKPDVSPMEPLIFPMNIAPRSAVIFSNLNAANGVAFDTASLKFGIAHVVIATGNAACKNALPTNAGLNILYPNPPKISFPIAIAKIAPIAVKNNEKLGGKINASNNPVIAALPSEIVTSLCLAFLIKASVPTHIPTLTSITNN